MTLYVVDTSSLITLASAKVGDTPSLVHLLPLIQIVVVDTVANEATANLKYPDARLIKAQLDAGAIQILPNPTTLLDDLINNYGVDAGERDTIRLATTLSDRRVIIDDQEGFCVASRFGLQPLVLLDLLVELTHQGLLGKPLSLQIVQGIVRSGRYSTGFLQHTVYKLNEVNDADHV